MQSRFFSPELSTSDEEDPLVISTQPLPSLNASLTTYFENHVSRHSHVHSPLQLVAQELNDNIPSDSEDSLPPLDTDGPAWSTPVIGTKAEKQAILRKKAIKKQKSTIAMRQEEARVLEASEIEENVEEVLNFLKEKGLRFGQFLKFIFDPKNPKGNIRWHQFFAYAGEATEILDWWVSSKNSDTARNEVKDWAVNYVADLVGDEAKKVTKSKLLQTRKKAVDQQFVQAFNFSKLNKELKESAPVGMCILEKLGTSYQAEKKHTEKRKERTKMVVTMAALTCLGEYSHSNNMSKKMLGLYLYASGAQRQTMTVLSTLGISESYTNIVSKKKRRKKTSAEPQQGPINNESTPTISMRATGSNEPIEVSTTAELETESDPSSCYSGTLRQLSGSMRARARVIAATGLYSTVYDNINMMFRSAEQIIGRHGTSKIFASGIRVHAYCGIDTQENGTCATLIPLFKARIEDLKTVEYQTHFLTAPSLKLTDILHTSQERKIFKKNLIFTILRIIIKNGGDGFEKFEKKLDEHQPFTNEKIELHKSALYPLPAWKIDESSIIGNAEVDQAIRSELDLDNVPDSSEHLRFYAGDQLSLARFRALENIRAGQETGFNAFFGSTWLAGLFHGKIADIHGNLVMHWGKPDTGGRDPGSLWYHNTRLHRLPITLSSPPPFKVSRDLIFLSLYARVLHCLLLVSKMSSIKEYLCKFSDWETLVSHAELIYDQHASSSVVENLREKRQMQEVAGDKITEGDMVFENAVLFMRDALVSREMTDAIKAGDSGRVVLVLKAWALSFRGNGRTKYAYEMLHLIHNLTSVWSKEIRSIVLNNWLLNPTGNPNSWVEIDLMQEHLNYWIKVFYKAHGSNASWEWLEHIAPCVDVLRELTRSFNDILGADQGTRHAPVDLSDDIRALMDSLNEHNVYQIRQGRVLDEDDGGPVKDAITTGLQSLTAGTKNPLSEYNEAFRLLQRRRKIIPVSAQAEADRVSHVRPEHDVSNDTETTEIYSETGIHTIPTIPSTSGLQVHGLRLEGQTRSDPVIDSFEEEDVVQEEEKITEVARIIEDLENGVVDPTLARLGGEDVALDMDDVLEYQDSDDDFSDSSSEGTDGG